VGEQVNIDPVFILDAEWMTFDEDVGKVDHSRRITATIRMFDESVDKLLNMMKAGDMRWFRGTDVEYEKPYTFLVWCDRYAKMYLLVNAYFVSSTQLEEPDREATIETVYQCEAVQIVPYVADKEAIRMWP
jgi:hypothetical protein